MQNKKILNIVYLMAFTALAIFFVPKALAAYDCTVAYPGADSTSPFTYDSCCYSPTSAPTTEPYQGLYCRPDNAVVRKAGSNPPLCSAYTDVLTLATASRSGNKLGFNCFDGTINAQCRANYCKDSTNTCVAISGLACPGGLNRVQICPGGCGACKENYVYCVANLPANLPDETVSPTLSCVLKKDGSTFAANGGKTCAELGRDVLNPCTGECTSCPTGKTPSGRYTGVCVTFGERFLEVFADGLTWLGGQAWDPNGNGVADDFDKDGKAEMHAYDYSETGPTGLKDAFLKSDMSEVLNWNSSHLPPPLRWLLNNYNLCTVDADCVKAGYLCSEGGLCYNPNDGLGFACVNDSDCDITKGLVCDPTTKKCALPTGTTTGYTPCTLDTQCGAGGKCAAAGFCYMPINKDPCATNSDCNFLEGYVCNLLTLKCEIPTPNVNLTPQFVGVSAAAVNGNQGGYSAVDGICNTAYKGSHVCNSKEIINSYVIGATSLTGVIDIAWFNSAAPGNVTPAVNDCKGWANGSSNPFYANVWSFPLKSAGIRPCNSTNKFTCCK